MSFEGLKVMLRVRTWRTCIRLIRKREAIHALGKVKTFSVDQKLGNALVGSLTLGDLLTATITVMTLVMSLLPFLWKPLADTIKHVQVGDQLAASGVILGVGGFLLIMIQLFRTQDAAVSTKSAIESLQFRVSAVDEVQLCVSCINTISEIERLHSTAATAPRIETYILLPERYRVMRDLLTQLRANVEETLTLDQKACARAATICLNQNIIRIQTSMVRGSKFPSFQAVDAALVAVKEMLTELSVDLQSKVVRGVGGR